MKLIDNILTCRSLSIVGMEKNTGKTEFLNYILNEIRYSGRSVAVTSIGIDGEGKDQVTDTEKPEITLYEGMWFVTSEKHYREKQLTAEIYGVSGKQTALGKLVLAKVIDEGKVLLSGPSDTAGIKKMIDRLHARGIETVIVDGALSRKSLGAPTVTEAMIMTTGAAVSANIQQLVRKTKYIYDLISVKETDQTLRDKLAGIEKGIWAIDESGEVYDLKIDSGLRFSGTEDLKDIFKYGNKFYTPGAVGDKFLDFLGRQKKEVQLIIRDFTRMFVTPEIYYSYMKRGNKLEVLQQNRLLAIGINPQSPAGFTLDSETLRDTLQQEVNVPVIDVRKIG